MRTDEQPVPQLVMACGCTVLRLGEHLHTVGCSKRHEAALDRLWAQWCAERHIPYRVVSPARN